MKPTVPGPTTTDLQGLALLALLLAALLSFQFRQSFLPGETLRLNDGPLGAQLAKANQFPSAFDGIWQDLNRVGAAGGSATLDITYLLRWALGPYGFCKFHAPISLWILGLCAWLGLRSMGFSPATCLLGGLAAALNSNFFSNACWGLASRPLTLAMMFLAMAAMTTPWIARTWQRIVLAGVAIGTGVTESADVGVIFSLLFGGFVVAHCLIQAEGRLWLRALGRGLGITLGVGVIAGLASFHLLASLLNAGIDPLHTAGTTFESEQQHWDWATQWSLPKSEVPRVFIAGLHGYLMGTEDGRDYWGGAGRDPYWQPGNGRLARHSGAGEYAGVPVCLVALFAIFLSLQRGSGSFPGGDRRWIWFWSAVTVGTLAFALGRHAPFYQALVSLPYFSSTRNPIKWMHGFHLALLLLFAYGVEGLGRLYLAKLISSPSSATTRSKSSGKLPEQARGNFGGSWRRVTAIGLAFAFVGMLAYSVSRGALEQHLRGLDLRPELVPRIAATSIREGWIAASLLAASGALVWLIVAGNFRGRHGTWAWGLLGALVIGDLTRANAPWIVHYNYERRYADAPLWQQVRQPVMPPRTTVAPLNHPELPALSWLQSVYQAEWLQHQFPRFDIPSSDISQDPRPGSDYQVYRGAFKSNLARFWELTSTRYFLGLAHPFAELLNQLADPEKRRFTTVNQFNIQADPALGFRPEIDPSGPFGLIEFNGAMPRANLFGRWAEADDAATLHQLANPAFEPTNLVLVARQTPAPAPPPGLQATRSNLVVKAYSPKRITLESDADGPTVLMLNDKYHPDWKVRVDGVLTPLLRCNYLMRGVRLPRGSHQVEFSFEPSRRGLVVSGTMLLIAAGLTLAQIFSRSRSAVSSRLCC